MPDKSFDKDVALRNFWDVATQILKSLQPVIEHAVKEYLSEVKRRA